MTTEIVGKSRSLVAKECTSLTQDDNRKTKENDKTEFTSNGKSEEGFFAALRMTAQKNGVSGRGWREEAWVRCSAG